MSTSFPRANAGTNAGHEFRAAMTYIAHQHALGRMHYVEARRPPCAMKRPWSRVGQVPS